MQIAIGIKDWNLHQYDQNRLLDILCETLNSQQVEYIDLATWSYINPGFKGSAVISATAWEHPVFDPASQLTTNPIGLAAVIIERGPAEAFDTPGDHSAGTLAFPLTTINQKLRVPNSCP